MPNNDAKNLIEFIDILNVKNFVELANKTCKLLVEKFSSQNADFAYFYLSGYERKIYYSRKEDKKTAKISITESDTSEFKKIYYSLQKHYDCPLFSSNQKNNTFEYWNKSEKNQKMNLKSV